MFALTSCQQCSPAVIGRAYDHSLFLRNNLNQVMNVDRRVSDNPPGRELVLHGFSSSVRSPHGLGLEW